MSKNNHTYTNDVHSHIDPFPPMIPEIQIWAVLQAALIQKNKEDENVLLVDAGDIFQGTPYFNYYGGELEFKLMSMMQYDASTIGNQILTMVSPVYTLKCHMQNSNFYLQLHFKTP
jgi:5'-nucleotidase